MNEDAKTYSEVADEMLLIATELQKFAPRDKLRLAEIGSKIGQLADELGEAAKQERSVYREAMVSIAERISEGVLQETETLSKLCQNLEKLDGMLAQETSRIVDEMLLMAEAISAATPQEEFAEIASELCQLAEQIYVVVCSPVSDGLH